MAQRRYAEGTRVSVEDTQTEIRRLLGRYGCKSFALAEDEQRSAIQFIFDGLPYRFTVERPDASALREDFVKDRYENTSLSMVAVKNRAAAIDWNDKVQQEFRRRWRARLLWLKATLEFADSEGGQFFRQAMMSALVLPSGETMIAKVERELPGAYQSGNMPPLLT